MKTIITFGQNHLPGVMIRPMSVMLIIEADTEREARDQVMNSFIGKAFCTSYPYEPYAKEFTEKHGMVQYTLEDIEKLRR
jgi:hypothetical protein